MDFIKKHYEKIVLSVVLLSLAVGAALLPLKVSDVRQNLEDTQAGLTVRSKPKLFKPVDLTTNEIVVKRSLNVKPFDFATPHNIFNPVEWRKKPDGGLIKMETGTEAGGGRIDRGGYFIASPQCHSGLCVRERRGLPLPFHRRA